MQEIIVYRNPLEAAVWSALMSGSGGVTIFFIVIALGAIWAGVYVMCDKFALSRSRIKPWGSVRYGQWAHSGKVATAVTITVAVCLHFYYWHS